MKGLSILHDEGRKRALIQKLLIAGCFVFAGGGFGCSIFGLTEHSGGVLFFSAIALLLGWSAMSDEIRRT